MGLILLQGAQTGAVGAEPPWPLTLTTAYCPFHVKGIRLTVPLLDVSGDCYKSIFV